MKEVPDLYVYSLIERHPTDELHEYWYITVIDKKEIITKRYFFKETIDNIIANTNNKEFNIIKMFISDEMYKKLHKGRLASFFDIAGEEYKEFQILEKRKNNEKN